MPKSESSRLEALEQLLAERRKHEGYLAKLEERRAATPEHVFTRLRTEYLTKLTDLQVRAAAEAEGLEDGIEADRTAVAAIEERLAAVHEERLEGELRAEVGEYDPKDWTKKLTVLNATIAQLEKERETKAGAWERTQRLVSEARAGIAGVAVPAESGRAESPSIQREAPSAPAPAVANEARAADTAAGSPAASPPAAPPAKRPTEIAGAPSFDELAFLNSVVGRVSTPVPIPQPVPVPRASRPVPVEPEPTTGPSVAPRAPTPVRPPVEAVAPAAAAPVVPAPAPVAVPEPPPALAPTPVRPAPAVAPAAAPAAEGPSAPAPAPREDEPPGPLGRPTPRTSQAIKTLKCQECGTFNYPTEWYCERCGGELAAL